MSEQPLGFHLLKFPMPSTHHSAHVGHATARRKNSITLVSPAKQSPDVSKDMVLDNDEGGCNFKRGNVCVESIGQPGPCYSILISTVVELIIEIGMASFYAELHNILADFFKFIIGYAILPNT